MAEENIQLKQPSDLDKFEWQPDFPLKEQAKNHLAFLKLIYENPHLNQDSILKNAVKRYEHLWLPLVSKYQTNDPEFDLEPPLDVHWIWHCHMLSPLDYIQDCGRICGKVLFHTLKENNSQGYYSALAKTEQLWCQEYPNEPFDYQTFIMKETVENPISKDRSEANESNKSELTIEDNGNEMSNKAKESGGNSKQTENTADSEQKESESTQSEAEENNGETSEENGKSNRSCNYELLAATSRQRTFFYQVLLPHFLDDKFLESAVERYRKFLWLKKENPQMFIVPMYDIDLMWHTHLLHPQVYGRDTNGIVGYIIPHDDKDQDRSATSKLMTSANDTKAAWKEKYGGIYAINGTCYRGRSFKGLLNQDKETLPTLVTYVAKVNNISVTGCHGNDTIAGKLCDVDGHLLLNLPKAQVKDGMLIWEPNESVELSTAESEETVHSRIQLQLFKTTGWFGGLQASPFKEILIDFPLKENLLSMKSELKTTDGNMEVMINFSVTDIQKKKKIPLVIEWGRFKTEEIPTDPQEAWGLVNLHHDFPVVNRPKCSIGTHSVKLGGMTVYTVKIIHILDRGLSFTQVYRGDHLVATAEMITQYQLPSVGQVKDPSKCVTLEDIERAVLIKNYDGDWGIVKGHQLHHQGLIPRFLSDTKVIASLTILSPFTTGTFSMSQSAPWRYSVSAWTGFLPNTSKMELFGDHGIRVNIASSSIEVGECCEHLAEFLAAVFSVWVE